MAALSTHDDVAARFEALFDAELPYVWTSLRRLGVAPRDLEDVAHELFLRVLKRLPSCDTSQPMRPWLFAFAVRLASDYRSLARHKTGFLGDNETTYAGPSSEELFAQAEREKLVQRALDQIELDRRAVFVLYEIDEVPMAEIANALGIPENTGYSRLRVAREEFAASIRRLTQQG